MVGGSSKRIKLDSSSEASDESETGLDMDDSIRKNIEHHRVYTDNSLTESEQKELCQKFKSLHRELIRKGAVENATELLNILDILLEEDLISQADSMNGRNIVNRDCQAAVFL